MESDAHNLMRIEWRGALMGQVGMCPACGSSIGFGIDETYGDTFHLQQE